MMKKIISVVLLFTFTLACSLAGADSYVKASVSTPVMENSSGSVIYTVGVGSRVNDWLSLEVDYRHLGGDTADVGGILRDPNSAQVADPANAGQTIPACALTAVGCRNSRGHGNNSTNGIGLSAMFTKVLSPGKLSVFTRVGALYSKSKYEQTYSVARPDLLATTTYSNKFVPMIGLGMNIDNFTFEVTQYQSAYLWDNGSRTSATAFSLGYKLGL